jgi:hypothetical protein
MGMSLKRTRLTLFFVTALTILTSACGIRGGTAVSNEMVPTTATYLTAGTLSGTTGVSGTAQVYTNNGTILLHLEGLVTPSGTKYGVFLEAGSPSAPFYVSSLKAVQGNQNYDTGQLPPAGNHFSRVSLRATTSTQSTEMAAAVLTAY